MQPSYFIGITLPDELGRKIAEVQQKLFQPGKPSSRTSSLLDRVMDPLTPHITLLHSNMLQTLAPIYFVPKVKEAAEANLPIQIKLTETALFDKRVLHIAVESPALIELQKKLVELLPEKVCAQYNVDRSFTAHLTLVQAKPKQNLSDELIESLRQQIDPLLPYEFTTTSLAQFTWLRPRTYKIEQL